MEKTNKNQDIKSASAVPLFILLFTIGAAFFPVWRGELNSHRDFTMRRAESLGYQIIEARAGGGRGPASEAETSFNHYLMDKGNIGLDSWGRPFQFRILKKTPFNSAKVMVWSKGPNGVDESESHQLATDQVNGPVELSGDDVGVLLTIK